METIISWFLLEDKKAEYNLVKRVRVEFTKFTNFASTEGEVRGLDFSHKKGGFEGVSLRGIIISLSK